MTAPPKIISQSHQFIKPLQNFVHFMLLILYDSAFPRNLFYSSYGVCLNVLGNIIRNGES